MSRKPRKIQVMLLHTLIACMSLSAAEPQTLDVHSFYQTSHTGSHVSLQAQPDRGNLLEWLVSIVLPTRPPPQMSTTTEATTASTSTATTTDAASLPLDRDCEPCICGTTNTVPRIVGGQETPAQQYPWMAIVELFQQYYCGGALINDLYVATAAHCVQGVPAEFFTIKLLAHDRSSNSSDEDTVTRRVTFVCTHERYNARNFDNDIALLRLDSPVNVTGALRPVCLPGYWHTFEGETAIVTGWGALSASGPAVSVLREVNVTVLSQEECRNTSYGAEQITDNMLCAGDVEQGGKDACHGDSGGPLHVAYGALPGQYLLAGIVSWGDGCARPNAPGVYARVSQYERWIQTHTPGACECYGELQE